MERIDFADLVAKNRRWTWVLLGASFLLLALVALTVSIYLGGGLVGVIAGVAVAMALTFASYASSDKIALSATRAREAGDHADEAATEVDGHREADHGKH